MNSSSIVTILILLLLINVVTSAKQPPDAQQCTEWFNDALSNAQKIKMFVNVNIDVDNYHPMHDEAIQTLPLLRRLYTRVGTYARALDDSKVHSLPREEGLSLLSSLWINPGTKSPSRLQLSSCFQQGLPWSVLNNVKLLETLSDRTMTTPEWRQNVPTLIETLNRLDNIVRWLWSVYLNVETPRRKELQTDKDAYIKASKEKKDNEDNVTLEMKLASRRPKVLVVGAGPIGLLNALQAYKSGTSVTVSAQRRDYTRNQWIDIWGHPYSHALYLLRGYGYTYLEMETIDTSELGTNDGTVKDKYVNTLRLHVLERFLAKICALQIGIRLMYEWQYVHHCNSQSIDQRHTAILGKNHEYSSMLATGGNIGIEDGLQHAMGPFSALDYEITPTKHSSSGCEYAHIGNFTSFYPIPFDVLIGSDGVHSRVRSSYGVTFQNKETFVFGNKFWMRQHDLAQHALLLSLKPPMNNSTACPETLDIDPWKPTFDIVGITAVFKRFWRGHCHVQVLFNWDIGRAFNDQFHFFRTYSDEEVKSEVERRVGERAEKDKAAEKGDVMVNDMDADANADLGRAFYDQLALDLNKLRLDHEVEKDASKWQGVAFPLELVRTVLNSILRHPLNTTADMLEAVARRPNQPNLYDMEIIELRIKQASESVLIVSPDGHALLKKSHKKARNIHSTSVDIRRRERRRRQLARVESSSRKNKDEVIVELKKRYKEEDDAELSREKVRKNTEAETIKNRHDGRLAVVVFTGDALQTAHFRLGIGINKGVIALKELKALLRGLRRIGVHRLHTGKGGQKELLVKEIDTMEKASSKQLRRLVQFQNSIMFYEAYCNFVVFFDLEKLNNIEKGVQTFGREYKDYTYTEWYDKDKRKDECRYIRQAMKTTSYVPVKFHYNDGQIEDDPDGRQ